MNWRDVSLTLPDLGWLWGLGAELDLSLCLFLPKQIVLCVR